MNFGAVLCVAKMRRTLTQTLKLKLSWRELSVIAFSFTIIYFSGLTMYLFEENYYTQFRYPLEVNMLKLISQLKAKRKPDVEPINRFQYEFISDCHKKCRNDLGTLQMIRLLFVVKSAVNHFSNRQAIRQTWGRENRFSDVSVRTVFALGVPATDVDDDQDKQLQLQVLAEQQQFHDIVQCNFVDNYFNNTLKALMAFHWVANQCSRAEFVFLVDDDYYVSTKNVLRYLRKPNFYPRHLQRPFFESDTRLSAPKGRNRGDGDQDDELRKLSESPMYVGYVFPSSKPHRIRTSKWAIDLQEYPYSRFPPYVTAGAYLLSSESLFMFYYTSLYTKPFRFDDVYVGIVAKKCYVDPVHNPHFYFYKLPYSKKEYEFCIASHGYEDPKEMTRVWSEQHAMGNA